MHETKNPNLGNVGRRNIGVMVASGLIWTPISTAMVTYWQPYLSELGATPSEIALIAASSTLVLSGSRILGGYLADSIGRRRLIVSMTYAVSLTYLALFFAKTWRAVLLVSILMSIFLLYQPATEAIIADSTPEVSRARSYATLYAVPNIAIMFSPVLAYAVVSRWGLVYGTRILILLTAFAGFVVGSIRLALLKETIDKGRTRTRDMWSEYREALSVVLKNRHIVLLVILASTLSGLTMMIQLYAIYYLRAGLVAWACLRLLYGATFVALLIPAGIIADSKGRDRAILLSAILLLLGLISLVLAPMVFPIVFLAAYMVLSGAFWAFETCTIPALEADILPTHIRGKCFAVIELVGSLAAALAQILAGVMYEYIGEELPFLLAIPISVAMMLIAIRSMRRE